METLEVGPQGSALVLSFHRFTFFLLSILVQIKPWHNWQRFSKTKRKAKTDTVITASLRPISSHSIFASSRFPPKALSLTGQQAWGSCWLKASRAGCSVSPWDSERKEWWMFLTEKVDDRQTEICCTAFTWSYLHFTGLSVRVVLSYNMIHLVGRLPRWLTGYRIHLKCRRHRQRQVQSPGREDSLEEGRQPTPVSLPGESHGWRSLVGYSPQGRRVGHNWVTEHACTHLHWLVLNGKNCASFLFIFSLYRCFTDE